MESPWKPNPADASTRSEASPNSPAASAQNTLTRDRAIHPAPEPRAGGGGTNPVPAYRIHRGKQLGYVRLNRRMIYLGKANTPESFERYRRALGEWLASGRVPGRGNRRINLAVTVSAIVDAYLAWARHYYMDADGRQSCGLAPVEAAAKSLTALYGSTPAGEFGPVVCLENEVKSLGLRRRKEEQLDWFRERENRDVEREIQRRQAEQIRQAQLAGR